MIELLDVIVTDDVTARVVKPRMMVCISPVMLEFLRINTRDRFKPCVPLSRLPHHPFLAHDSFVECNILELDEYVVEQSIGRNSIVGRLHDRMKAEIYERIQGLTYITKADKQRIRHDFGIH